MKWKHHDFVTLGFVTLPDLPVFVPCLISDLGGDNPRESDPALANIGFPVPSLSKLTKQWVLI